MELFRKKQSDVYLAAKAAFKLSQDWEQIDLLQRSYDHQIIGLDAGKSSADYIHLYDGNAALLAESLEVIQQTASIILAALEPPIEEEAAQTTTDELAEVA